MKRSPSEYNKYKKDKCLLHNTTCLGPLTVDHVKTLGSGGSDEPENLMTLCVNHHNQKGSLGISRMAEYFPVYRQWLVDNGWEYDEFRLKWVRYNKEEDESNSTPNE